MRFQYTVKATITLAKRGYFRVFSESVLTGVNIFIFVNLKIKTYQNKHAFHTFK